MEGDTTPPTLSCDKEKKKKKKKKKKKINNNTNNHKGADPPPQDQGTSNPQSSSARKRKRKEVAVFGNYRNYYGYRVGQDFVEDPRLKVMKREWFEGKDCLDIGCNSGLLTIAMAKKFGCRSILGVDIDGARIEDANWTLRKVVKTGTVNTVLKTQHSSDVKLANGSETSGTHSQAEQAVPDSGDSPPQEARDLFNVVSFQKGNFVQAWHPPENTRYHLISCLSVSKWVHLNWGDEGLITLFWRVWKLLHTGGVFILEPQPWSSYHSNRQVSETTAANYKTIQIAPQDFQDVLLDKIGFRRVEDVTSKLSGTKSGFNRPVLAFWK